MSDGGALPKAQLTDYHAKYLAYELTKRCASDSVEKLAAVLADAQVDLNPHQVEAALFAFRSPFSKGAILADEVGLGKTIEAGLLLSQKWAERKRRLLVIVPANLRKQWSQELADKFYLPSVILETRSFNDTIRAGNLNPFQQDAIILCSYQFARTKEPYLRQTSWNLVVIDEAHRLRNVYKNTSKIALAIKQAVAAFPKVLLTATPLQNTLLELYGLVSIIDDFAFGDLQSYRARFARLGDTADFTDLKERLKPLCKRTLRRQVLEYVKFTNRRALVQEFVPSEDEQRLYDLVSDYLQRPTLYALPASQRQLVTLILRKLLASSTYAISGTLSGLVQRLEAAASAATAVEAPPEDLPQDWEALDELADEWEGEGDGASQPERARLTPEQVAELRLEMEHLRQFHALAKSIVRNSKGEVLLSALRRGFAAAADAQKSQGAPTPHPKAVIFTESRRTQEYLFRLLEQTEFAATVMLFNGTNNDPTSKAIYQRWLAHHAGSDRITGSASADIRAALVEHFRDHASILIATEAAAEGINLQFCNLVVNYDLPWNPQRIEQRIGRCHRFGQKFDVVVVNFLNKQNAADQRVYELLDEKFRLFSGIFGASDEVLGAVESGVDFEKRIAAIYQQCRTLEQIQFEFDQLQRELETQIAEGQRDAREKLLDNFDQEVVEKVRIQSHAMLDRFNEQLWRLTRHLYREHAAERNLQDKLNADTEKTLADNLEPRWKALLFAADPTYQSKDKKDTRNVLQKHLCAYTARHQFDYFIHKDLGDFLRRELDFYIKNEVMHPDDIESTAAPKAEEYLSKIRAARRCALPVIRMLAQLEDFQKKLWLKKKFVVETRYCMTLDRVPEALFPEICANDTQWNEWEQLYALSVAPKDLLSQPPRTPAFLKAQPHLMLDTRHFDRAFTLKLLAGVDNLDDSLDGVCFHSENFQALRFIQERYQERVKCIYIDPPYNTGNDGFTYKDRYPHSTWLSMIDDRLSASARLMERNSSIFSSVDDNEGHRLKFKLQQCFGEGNCVGEIVWQKRYAPDARTAISDAHEYILAFATDPEQFKATRNKLPLTEAQTKQFKNPDNDPRGAWKADNFTAQGYRPNQMYPITIPSGRVVTPPAGRCWVVTEPVFRQYEADGLMYYGASGDGAPAVKRFLRDMDGMVPWTWWAHQDVGHSQDGLKEVMRLFGREAAFLTAKPTSLLVRVFRIAAETDSTLLDFFAGSGTTGHAVINLNRGDGGHRKYVIVETGEHFDRVLVPRLKKVAYSTDWKDGKPQSRNTGISHAFKIVRLESYEDTLNNLHLRRTPEQEAALQKADEWQRDEYMLGYFLDVESAGSASLLDVGQLRDPFRYQLEIATRTAGETKPTSVDLVETFNWLIGLKVKHIDHQKGFLRVTGEQRSGDRVLILWRTLGDDTKADNAALERYLAKIMVNPADSDYKFIYVNGSHTLRDPHNKIHLIEEELQRRMFESDTFERLSDG